MKKYISMLTILALLMGSLSLLSCGKEEMKNTDDLIEKNENTTESNQLLASYMMYGGQLKTDGGMELTSLQTSLLPEQWYTSRSAYQDKNAPKTVTLKIAGEEFEYSYAVAAEYTPMDVPMGNRVVYKYGKSQEGSATIDAETGKVLAWQNAVPGPSVYDTIFKMDKNGDRIYDMDMSQLKAIAENYAKELVGADQLAKYEFVVDDAVVYFYRMVNGHITNEYIRMVLQADGTLYAFNLRNIGLFDTVSELNFDEEKAIDQIEDQLAKAYGDTKYTIEPVKQTVIRLPNGQCAYKYEVSTMYADGEGYMYEGQLCYDWMSHTFEFVIPA